MALGATIYKVALQVSDLDRNYYENHSLTIAQHPSETGLRMMLRILVFALNAGPELSFTRGLSSDDVPDLWQKDLRGDIQHWIEVGQPSLKRLRKACSQASQVSVYAHSGQRASAWWQQNGKELEQLSKMAVIYFPAEQTSSLESLIKRNMSLQCVNQDGLIWFGDEQNSFDIHPIVWQAGITDN